MAALLGLLACESRYGAYLKLEGDIDIDSVELYFGSAIDSNGSPTGPFASSRNGVQSGVIFDRRFSPYDRYDLAPTRATTFYIPPDDVNRELGDYVVAVASRGQQPAGIAEYFGFEVPTDEVHEYQLHVEPYDGARVERWGREPGCISWKRDRGDPIKQLVAVIQADNRDCDDAILATDCNDLCSIGCCTCVAPTTLCTSPCALGCTESGLCTPSTCVPVETCSTTCMQSSTLASQYQCAIESASAQLTIQVDTFQTQMCSHQYQFDLSPDASQPIPCVDPKIEYVSATYGITYMIGADPTRPGGCVIMSTQSSSVAFSETDHMIVSFSAGTGLPRKSVIIAITPGNTSCVMMGYRVISRGPIYGC